MLAKCTNPSCSASFRHLADGRLFRLESDSPVGSSNAKMTEYFWLCGCCSAGLTLNLAQDGRVLPTGLRTGLLNGPEVGLISANRENGLFLRRVSFLSRSHPKGT
jgi:hypothetical protein